MRHEFWKKGSIEEADLDQHVVMVFTVLLIMDMKARAP